MDALFFVLALVMCVLAILVIAAPLLRMQKSDGTTTVGTPLLISICVILASIILYASNGRPDLVVRQANATSEVPAQSSGVKPNKSDSVGQLIAGLEARLEANPDDAKGWLLAAKSYDFLGRPEAALAALKKAQELGLNEPMLEQRLAVTNDLTENKTE